MARVDQLKEESARYRTIWVTHAAVYLATLGWVVERLINLNSSTISKDWLWLLAGVLALVLITANMILVHQQWTRKIRELGEA